MNKIFHVAVIVLSMGIFGKLNDFAFLKHFVELCLRMEGKIRNKTDLNRWIGNIMHELLQYIANALSRSVA